MNRPNPFTHYMMCPDCNKTALIADGLVAVHLGTEGLCPSGEKPPAPGVEVRELPTDGSLLWPDKQRR